MIAADRRASEDGPWLRCYARRPAATAAIVCFGPAGASASFFRGWERFAPEHVELWSLAYPGRERRVAEPPIASMDELADAIAAALEARVRARPTLLLGHSMGASVAFEVARRLEAGGRGPAALVISGRPGPRQQRRAPRGLDGYGDDRIVEYVRSLGGTPAQLLDDPELRDLILPPFRCDFALIGGYRPQPGPPLETPTSVIWGADDPELARDVAEDWASVLARPRAPRAFAGGHFYLVDRVGEVLGHAAALLEAQPRGATPDTTCARTGPAAALRAQPREATPDGACGRPEAAAAVLDAQQRGAGGGTPDANSRQQWRAGATGRGCGP